MRIPMPPPSLESIMHKVRGKGIDRLIEVVQDTRLASEPYLPWDKLRFKTPPDGIDHEEWWLATKLGRQGLQRRIPLTDERGKFFTYALTDEVLKAIENVNRHLSGHIAMAEKVANSANRDRYLVSSLIEEAITSSQLEGASTTHPVAKEMIRSGRSPIGRDERMILNNYNAMRRVRDFRGRSLTEERLFEIHQIVTDGTLDNPAAAGRYQLPGDQRIVVSDGFDGVLHRPPPAELLPERVRAVCRFANGEMGDAYVPGVIRAIIVHFMIGYEHPFEDGNGRTARALFYWVMLNQDYWLTEFLSISRILRNAPSRYAASFMHTEQDDNDLTYFILYQLSVIERAIKELHVYLERKMLEVRDFQRTLATAPGEFNHRQIAVLQHALRQPATQFTVQSHGLSHSVTRQTARQDLFDLEAHGLLVRHSSGRKFIWTAVNDLASRLEQG